MDFAILEIDENHEIARQAYAMSEGDVQVQQQPFGQFVKVVVYAIVANENKMAAIDFLFICFPFLLRI
jgi:hypothetical protein